MTPSTINTFIGIAAGIVTIVTGAFFIIEKLRKDRANDELVRPVPPPITQDGSSKTTERSKSGNGKAPVTVDPVGSSKGKSSPKVIEHGTTLFRTWEFQNNDAAYQDWLEQHPESFVVNTYPKENKSRDKCMILHRASCGTISNFASPRYKPGAFTGRDYVKVCGIAVDHLREWVNLHGRPDRSFTGECGLCKPLQGQKTPVVIQGVSHTILPPTAVAGVTQDEMAKIIAACQKLPHERARPEISDYMENVLLTVLDFMLNTIVVEKAAQHYLKFAQKEIHTHQDLKSLLTQYPDTKEGNTQVAQKLWGYNLWTRVELLRKFVAYLDSQHVTTQQELKDWAAKVTFKDFQGKVPGMGLAIFQWLIMRAGQDEVKPDIWVHKFLKKILGRDVDGNTAIAALKAAAASMGIKASDLDWRIWDYAKTTALPD